MVPGPGRGLRRRPAGTGGRRPRRRCAVVRCSPADRHVSAGRAAPTGRRRGERARRVLRRARAAESRSTSRSTPVPPSTAHPGWGSLSPLWSRPVAGGGVTPESGDRGRPLVMCLRRDARDHEGRHTAGGRNEAVCRAPSLRRCRRRHGTLPAPCRTSAGRSGRHVRIRGRRRVRRKRHERIVVCIRTEATCSRSPCLRSIVRWNIVRRVPSLGCNGHSPQRTTARRSQGWPRRSAPSARSGTIRKPLPSRSHRPDRGCGTWTPPSI